jgi:hypothetical protein
VIKHFLIEISETSATQNLIHLYPSLLLTTESGESYTYMGTAPATSYNVDVFFLGEYSGSQQYLPSKAAAAITVT